MKRALALFALGAALVLGASFPERAAGQTKPRAPAAASASASAAARPEAPASSSSALPAGHPPVGAPSTGVPPPNPQALPAGHPPVAGDDEEDEDPHAKGARGGDPRAFRAPEDTVTEDATLPAGTIVVTIADADGQPVPRAPITLGVLHSTVAKGDSNERVARDADAGGSARFDGLAFGSGHSYRVSTTRGAATYAHTPFSLGDKAGKRVVLHSYEASATLDSSMLVFMRGFVYVTLREDAIQVEQLVSVFNIGRVAWMADMPIQLPRGFKAFNKQEAMDDARVEEVAGTGAAIRGTFPPGQRDLDFRYQVPLDGVTAQKLEIRLPQRVTQARVIAEASKAMTLEVSGFPAAQRVEGKDGKHLLVTEITARAPGGASSLDVTLSGLPTPGPGRWIAVALAVLALGSGVFYFADSGNGPLDADAQKDLAEAREALLGEIVALERAHKSGEIGPKTYARVRASLLDALARIVAMLDEAKPKTKGTPKRPFNDGGSAPRPRANEGGSAPKPPPRRMEPST